MCETCNMTTEELIQKHQEMAEAYGHSMVGVFDAEIPFTYTVGLSKGDLPEIIFMSKFIDPQTQGAIVNYTVEALKKDPSLIEKGFVSIGGTHPLKVHQITRPTEDLEMGLAFQVLGNREFKVIQITAPDPYGRYPDDQDCISNFKVDLL